MLPCCCAVQTSAHEGELAKLEAVKEAVKISQLIATQRAAEAETHEVALVAREKTVSG